MFGSALLVAAAAAASTSPSDFSWLSGYWLSCVEGVEVSETWSNPQQGGIRGSGMTVSSDGKIRMEVMRVAPNKKGSLSYFAEPSGQPAAEFPLKSTGEQQAVFENPKHDFPQRILYRREGDQLFARIEGTRAGKTSGQEWLFAAAPLNASCPKQPQTEVIPAETVEQTDPATSPPEPTTEPPVEPPAQPPAMGPVDQPDEWTPMTPPTPSQ